MAHSSEKFCLKWNEFQQNMASSFKELRTDIAFTDVTLVCDDDQQLEAHKIILKSCSTFFNKVLTNNKHSHPMIYMRGLKTKDLEALVDFIYYGEANIYQEDLDDFLALAEELQLKGLTGYQSDNDEACEEPKILKQNNKRVQTKQQVTNGSQDSEVMNNTYFEDCKMKTSYDMQLVKVDPQMVLPEDVTKEEMEAKKISLMTKVEDGVCSWKCTVCGKTAKTRQHMKMHVETHMEGLSYPCNKCGKVSRSSNQFNTHISMFHRK